MKFVVIICTLVLAVAAQIPFPQPPSVAFIERQSGTIPIHWMPGTIAEYKTLGCSHIGVTKITPTLVNVWCVRVEME